MSDHVRMGVRPSITTFAVVVAGMCGCVKRLPPAPTPPAIVPPVAVPATPPPAGHGRLIVDIVEGAAPVTRSVIAADPIDAGNGRTKFRFSTRLDTVCPAAPCVLDLPLGNIVLGFPYLNEPTRFETQLIHIGPEPAVYRKALTLRQPAARGPKVLGVLATAFGGTSMMAGAALLPIGLATDRGGTALAGGITLGVGAALLAIGIVTLASNPAIERDGAHHHFQLQP